MGQTIRAPFVSAIVATHNRTKYLPEAVHSLLSQTYQNFEIIIVDDASSDDTYTLIESLAQTDPRIIAIRSELNIGPGAARNLGIRHAKGDYIAIMDDDDICHLERFEKQVDYLEINPDVMVLGTNITKINDEGETIGKVKYPMTHNQIRWQLIFRDVIANPSVMMRKILFDQLGFSYKESIRGAEDYDLWVNVSSLYKIANLDESLLFYRLHSTNITRTDSKTVEKNTMAIIIAQVKTYTDIDLPVELVSELINPRDVKDLEAVNLLAKILVRLQRNTSNWGLSKRDRYVINQSVVWRLRTLLKTHGTIYSLLPYRIYTWMLDPKYIIRNLPFTKLNS